jgi:hypothetical protein
LGNMNTSRWFAQYFFTSLFSKTVSELHTTNDLIAYPSTPSGIPITCRLGYAFESAKHILHLFESPGFLF